MKLGDLMYKNKFSYENTTKFIFNGEGIFNIPIINATDNIDNLENLIGFNYAMSNKKKDCGVHFFLDDYQFQRLWNNPEKYIEVLMKYPFVLSPDFSLYSDYPRALQIYNHYKKHWLAAYWQMYGIKVIPTICWSDEVSYNYCFDGEPKNSIVAVSSVGTQKSNKDKELFLQGYNEMLERLEPTQIIFYGTVPEECKGNIVQVKSFQEKFRRSE